MNPTTQEFGDWPGNYVQEVAQQIVLVDTLANRPAATWINNGYLFIASDTGIGYRSNGITWTAVFTIATFGAAGPSHSAGLVPDPGDTAHSPAYYLGDDGAFHPTSGFTEPEANTKMRQFCFG